MQRKPRTYFLSDGLTPMQRLIVCIAEAYERTDYAEATKNNADAWIGELWDCYHDGGNYGAYCMVASATIVNSASALAGCANLVPNAPARPKSRNREGTLYGNVYDTLQELILTQPQAVDNVPAVGSVFMRPGDSGRNNHAGIVVSAPLTDDVWIETIEANVSTSGYGGSNKGFQRVVYKKAAYDGFAARDWIRSSRAAAYNNMQPKGWYFYHAYRLCEATTTQYKAQLCLGVSVDCDLRTQPPATTSGCPPAPPTAAGFTQWYAVADILAEINRTSQTATITRLPRDNPKYPVAGREVTADNCWVRWKLDAINEPPVPPKRDPCPKGLVIKSCCEGGSATLSMPNAGQMLTLADLKNEGGRRAMLSSAIPENVRNAWNYGARYNSAGQFWPMLRLANGQSITIVSKGSIEYKIGREMGVFGPNPAFLELDRTALDGGTGAGWAERISNGMAPDGRLRSTGRSVVQDDLQLFKNSQIHSAVIDRVEMPVGMRDKEYIKLFALFDILDRNPELYKGRQLVVVIGGEPTTALGVLNGVAGYIGAAVNFVVPGVGTAIATAIQTANQAYLAGGISLENAFSFIGQLASGFAAMANDSGGKLFGVEAKTYNDLTRYSTRAWEVNNVFQRSGTAAGKARAIVSILSQEPDLRDLAGKLTSSLETEFAAEAKWVRGAFAEVNATVRGGLDTARAAVQNVSDGVSTTALASLRQLGGGVDSLFETLFASAESGFTKSATKIPLLQDIMGAAPHVSVLNARAGSADLFATVLRLGETFQADVKDATVHQAMAAIVSGKGMVDGALDQFQFDSMLQKAEDFARRKWKFDLPATIPEDKRECLQREIAVCIGTECCPPLVMFNGACVPARPPEDKGKQDCIRTEADGSLTYCKPASCEGKTPTKFETATILLRNETNTPYELTATRVKGTTTWTDYRVLFYEPVFGTQEYRKPTTVPIDAVAAGVSIDSNDFESVRKQQGARIFELSNPEAAAPAMPQGNDCVATYPARVVADGTNRIVAMVGDVWVEIENCCPKVYTERPPDRPTASGNCCAEVNALAAKIDKLTAAIAGVMGASQGGRVPTTTTDYVDTNTRRGTGVAPTTPSCDLSVVLRLLQEIKDGGATTVQSGADVAVLQQTLAQLEESIKSIKPTSPCDNSEVLTGLVKLQSSIERTILSSNAELKKQNESIIARLDALIASDVKVCDTETLRKELATQTATIRELRTLVEQGNKVDASAIERELVRQRDLLQVIVERLNNATVVTKAGDTTDKSVITTIVKCDDAELKQALSELRTMLKLLPTMQEELAMFRIEADKQFAILRSELGIASVILRDLQARKGDPAVLAEIRSQREELLRMIERFTQVAPTCDVSELRTLLVALRSITDANTAKIDALVERLRTTDGTTVCDTSTIREAVETAIAQRLDRFEQTLQRVLQVVEDGSVRTVNVNVESLERKIDEVLRRLQSERSYDNTELLRKIDALLRRGSREDVILQKLDLLMNETRDSGERRTLQEMRRKVKPTVRYKSEDCPDCPAYVEEHRRVFYRYPTGESTATTNAKQTQQQSQNLTILQPQQAYTQPVVVPVEMPCYDC